MTDRELLELAAKAAGIFVTREQFERDCTSPWDTDWEVLTYDSEANNISGWATIYGFKGELSGWGVTTWSPLTDDGDALRLAAILGIYFMVVHEQGHVVAKVRNGVRSAYIEKIGNDLFAAVRRAIVRAAAAIEERKNHE